MTGMNEIKPGPKEKGLRAGIYCRESDPLQILCDEHSLQLELCDVLEAIADKLPEKPDANLVQVAISILRKGWPRHVAMEEGCLFPLLEKRAGGNAEFVKVLEQLSHEHVDDEDLSAEIADALQDYLDTAKVRNPDALGYMLRGFFASQRRHIRWEDDVVLPMARTVLNASDLAQMHNWIIASDHPVCSRRSIVEIRDAQRFGSMCERCPVVRDDDTHE